MTGSGVIRHILSSSRAGDGGLRFRLRAREVTTPLPVHLRAGASTPPGLAEMNLAKR
jgi:hypothetical protein